MKRRAMLAGAIVCFAPFAAKAQPAKIVRIGILIDGASPHPLPEALRQGLAKLGHVEGRNVSYDLRYADGRADKAASEAKALVESGVDIIVAHFTPAVRAAMAATKTLPIVMAPAGAPVETGLVATLNRPGGNVTGLTNMAAELGGRRLQLLKDMIPTLGRVAVLASSTDPFTRPFLSYMERAAVSGGLTLDPVAVAGPPDFAQAFQQMTERRAGAVIIQGVFNSRRADILKLAAQHRMPTTWFDRQAVREGGLISLSARNEDIYERAAAMVDKILKGAKPQDLPVEQPALFELVINLKTAAALDIKVPHTVQVQADELIE